MILSVLNDSNAIPSSVHMIDSTIIRAHQQAAGAKGGFTTKVHLIANIMGLPTRLEISGGEVSDYKGYDLLYNGDGPAAKVLIADRGYDGDRIREHCQTNGGTAVIPGRRSRKEPIEIDRLI